MEAFPQFENAESNSGNAAVFKPAGDQTSSTFPGMQSPKRARSSSPGMQQGKTQVHVTSGSSNANTLKERAILAFKPKSKPVDMPSFQFRPTTVAFEADAIHFGELMRGVYEFLDSCQTEVLKERPAKGSLTISVFINQSQKVDVKLRLWAAHEFDNEHGRGLFCCEIEKRQGDTQAFNDFYQQFQNKVCPSVSSNLDVENVAIRSTNPDQKAADQRLEDQLATQMSNNKLTKPGSSRMSMSSDSMAVDEGDGTAHDAPSEQTWTNLIQSSTAEEPATWVSLAFDYNPNQLRPLAVLMQTQRVGLLQLIKEHADARSGPSGATNALGNLIVHMSNDKKCCEHLAEFSRDLVTSMVQIAANRPANKRSGMSKGENKSAFYVSVVSNLMANYVKFLENTQSFGLSMPPKPTQFPDFSRSAPDSCLQERYYVELQKNMAKAKGMLGM